jgi:hypothetical protein
LSTVNEEQAKRLAIVIGINKYEDATEIPELFGAENDAIEIHKRLTTLGEFEVNPNHLLLGKNATYKAILKAVSDIFRQAIDCSLVIFYFSGHGLIDENNDGYIAPYDMDSADPFVCGIKMEDLREVIYRAKNKESVLLILDCCYAGIATKGTKSIPDLDSRITYENNLKRLSEPPSDKLVSSGRGKIILASSEASAPSREKNDCKHYKQNGGPHTHGAFTFHLIEGLDGKAAVKDTGIINIENLQKYVEEQLITDGKQKPLYSIDEAFRTENIILSKSLDLFNDKVKRLIGEADNFCKNEDIQSLTQASKKVVELTTLDPKNKEIPRLIESINNSAYLYTTPLTEWLTNNYQSLNLEVDQIRKGLYDDFYSLVDLLSYNELQKIKDAPLLYLVTLCREVGKQTVYKSGDKKSIESLLRRIRSISHMEGRK